MSGADAQGLGRRELLAGAGAAAATVGVAAFVAHGSADPATGSGSAQTPVVGAAEVGAPIEPHGPVQAGIVAPTPPQSIVQILVLTRGAGVRAEQLIEGLDEVIDALVTRPLGFDEVNDLTITVGLALPVMRELAPSATWPDDLPTFDREELGEAHGGDLMLQIGATSPAVMTAAQAGLLAHFEGTAELLWSQVGSRGPQDERGVFRNAMGFPDGIAAPRTEPERDLGVWIEPPGGDSPWSGASYVVVRRLRVDIARWSRMSLSQQEASVGRAKDTGAPLSGGVRDDTVDLLAKYPDGAWKVPAGAHARRAFPTFVGRPLMLRRSFGYANQAAPGGTPDEGVLFVAYLSDPETFVLTQRRLDELDELMALTTCTASGAFFVPRGYTSDRTLASWVESIHR